jgi:hypothetical protein
MIEDKTEGSNEEDEGADYLIIKLFNDTVSAAGVI